MFILISEKEEGSGKFKLTKLIIIISLINNYDFYIINLIYSVLILIKVY